MSSVQAAHRICSGHLHLLHTCPTTSWSTQLAFGQRRSEQKLPCSFRAPDGTQGLTPPSKREGSLTGPRPFAAAVGGPGMPPWLREQLCHADSVRHIPSRRAAAPPLTRPARQLAAAASTSRTSASSLSRAAPPAPSTLVPCSVRGLMLFQATTRAFRTEPPPGTCRGSAREGSTTRRALVPPL